MRRSLILLLVFCSVYGVLVYQLKYRVMHLESELQGINRQLIAEKESIHILRAEISYVTRPDQLTKLSAKYLDLSPVKVQQIYALADIAPNMPSYAEAAATPRERPILASSAEGMAANSSGAVEDDITPSAAGTGVE